jgi:hypothetical protein
MSPEIMNNQKYNSKTDIWSLGVILYEMVCLRLPFQGNSMRQLCSNIISANPAPPPPAYSSQMKELLRDILAKDPRKRPSVNNILSRPLIKDRIQNFLNETKLQREFSHTILHGVNVLSAPAPNSILSVPQQQPQPSAAAAGNQPYSRPFPLQPQQQQQVMKPRAAPLSNPAVAPKPLIIAQAQQQQPQATPQQIAAKYKIMVPPSSRPSPPSAGAGVEAPKSVDEIIRNILRRDKEKAMVAAKNNNVNKPSNPSPPSYYAQQQQKPTPQQYPLPKEVYKQPNIISHSAQNNRPAPVVKEDPNKYVIRSQQQQQGVLNPQKANPFEIIVGKPPQRFSEPSVVPANKAPVPKKVVESKPVQYDAKPVQVAAEKNNIAQKPALPVFRKPSERPPSAGGPIVKQQSPSVVDNKNNNGDNYSSPKEALQHRNVENSERMSKIDAIIGKAAAVLEVIKKEKLKQDQRINSPPGYYENYQQQKLKTPSSVGSSSPTSSEPSPVVVPVKKYPIVQGIQNNKPTPVPLMRPVVSPSPPSSEASTPMKADMPWLQNLQNQMGALKVQVSNLQVNRGVSPSPSIEELQKSPPPDIEKPPSSKPPSSVAEKPPLPYYLQKKAQGPTPPPASSEAVAVAAAAAGGPRRQSFPLESNNQISNKNKPPSARASPSPSPILISGQQQQKKPVSKGASPIPSSGKDNNSKGKVNKTPVGGPSDKNKKKKVDTPASEGKKTPKPKEFGKWKFKNLIFFSFCCLLIIKLHRSTI